MKRRQKGEDVKEGDVVILSGGVSIGDYDLVRGTLEENNVRLLFEKIAVKPGRPMVFGILDKGEPRPAKKSHNANRVFCFGLPGNPVSAFVVFDLLVTPFLYKMMGHIFKPAVTHGQLERTITRKKTERDSWLPVVFTKNGNVVTIEYHGSAHINALCDADGLLRIPAGVAKVEKGTTVTVRQI